MANTIARETVEELASRLAEPVWLTEERLFAWETYLQLPMPVERDEDWKSTDISALDLSCLRMLQMQARVASSPMPASSDQAGQVHPGMPRWIDTAFSQLGRLSGALVHRTAGEPLCLLDPGVASRGVIFCDIFTAAADHGDKLRSLAARSGEPAKFEMLTRALFNCGMFLYIPKGVELEAPFLYALDWSEKTPDSAACLPWVLVVAERDSRAAVICAAGTDGSAGGAPLSLLSQYSQVSVQPGASLKWLESDNLAFEIFMVNRMETRVERNGRLDSLSVALGARQIKSDIIVDLAEPGASSDVLGVVLGARAERFSFNTVQEHNAPDTGSNINFRVALADQSASVYQGAIRVAKVAQRTDSYQSNKNLLLSGSAKADSIPRLEILADDVKCAHGATVGPVDREQIFYLRTRGLTQTEAEELVVLGFFRQVLEAFPLPTALNWLSSLVSAKIHQGEDSGVDFFVELGEEG